MEVWVFVSRLVLTGLLYVFLAAVLVVLWQDVRVAPVNVQPIQMRHAHLLVLEGNEHLPAGRLVTLRPFSTLGRDAGGTVVVPDTYVSAEHAIIAWRAGQWWLEDCGSRNGTILNDVRLTSSLVLKHGDIIGIGHFRLQFEDNQPNTSSL